MLARRARFCEYSETMEKCTFRFWGLVIELVVGFGLVLGLCSAELSSHLDRKTNFETSEKHELEIWVEVEKVFLSMGCGERKIY